MGKSEARDRLEAISKLLSDIDSDIDDLVDAENKVPGWVLDIEGCVTAALSELHEALSYITPAPK